MPLPPPRSTRRPITTAASTTPDDQRQRCGSASASTACVGSPRARSGPVPCARPSSGADRLRDSSTPCVLLAVRTSQGTESPPSGCLRGPGGLPMLAVPSPAGAGESRRPTRGGWRSGTNLGRPDRAGPGRAETGRARRVLQDHRARLHDAHRDLRRHHDVADDGLHPVPEPRHPRRDPGQHRHQPDVPRGADGDGAGRRRHDAGDGHRGQVPLRDRRRPRAQRVRGVHARRAARADLARGDGRDRDRGPAHLGPGPDGPARDDHGRDPDGPEARDRDRDRDVPGDHRVRQRRRRRRRAPAPRSRSPPTSRRSRSSCSSSRWP